MRPASTTSRKAPTLSNWKDKVAVPVMVLFLLQEMPTRPTILSKKSGSAFQRKEAEGRERARMIPMDSGPSPSHGRTVKDSVLLILTRMPSRVLSLGGPERGHLERSGARRSLKLTDVRKDKQKLGYIVPSLGIYLVLTIFSCYRNMKARCANVVNVNLAVGFKTCIALYIWVLSPNENCIFSPFVWLRVH
ncbi:hypothetical protein RHGRI_035349 [Rhododendron griersonianum]|uniref:Uncharacterized protein n=1 Tax=Rhododendron griersonianum TaxID=479676 RepID=A0AAV6I834_9ERIC|nr:hypothetical protein RHGRI_035349 [Rhododendron griersonianum]